MKRSAFTLLALTLAFALAAGPSVTASVQVAEAPDPTLLTPAEVTGAGPDLGTFLACVGCAAGATMIAAGGPVAIFAALNNPGSVLAAAACLGACGAVAAS